MHAAELASDLLVAHPLCMQGKHAYQYLGSCASNGLVYHRLFALCANFAASTLNMQTNTQASCGGTVLQGCRTSDVSSINDTTSQAAQASPASSTPWLQCTQGEAIAGLRTYFFISGELHSSC